MWANQKAQDAGLENAFGLLDPDERTFEGNALIPDPGAVCPGCCANCSSKKETPLDALAKVKISNYSLIHGSRVIYFRSFLLTYKDLPRIRL